MRAGLIDRVTRATIAAAVAVTLLATGVFAQDDDVADGQSPPPAVATAGQGAANDSIADGSGAGTSVWLLTPFVPLVLIESNLFERPFTAVAVDGQTGEVVSTVDVTAAGCLWMPPVVSDGTSIWLSAPRFFSLVSCLGRFPLDGSPPDIMRVEMAEARDQVELGPYSAWGPQGSSITPRDGSLYFIGNSSDQNGLYRYDPVADSVELVVPDAGSLARSGDALYILLAAHICGGVKVLDPGGTTFRDVKGTKLRNLKGAKKERLCLMQLAASDDLVAIASTSSKGVLLDPQTEEVIGDLGKKGVRNPVVSEGNVWVGRLNKKSQMRPGYVVRGRKSKYRSDGCEACIDFVVGVSPGAVWTQSSQGPIRRIDAATRVVTLELDLNELVEDPQP